MDPCDLIEILLCTRIRITKTAGRTAPGLENFLPCGYNQLTMMESGTERPVAEKTLLRALEGSGGFWDKYGQKVIMGVIAAYLLLLFVGVMAELFDIQSVLDWWIWRPPGKGPTGPPT